MSKGDYVGEFEQLVMLAVVLLGRTAYGMTIRRQIEERTSRDVSIGSIYAALERLERKGLVHSWEGEATPERGGRAKRYVELTAAGKQALTITDEAYMRMRQGATRKLAWGKS